MSRRRALLLQAGGGAFSPLNYGSPVHAFWAEDPAWSDPGDGNAVSSWRNDGSDGTAATQASGTLQPIFRSAGVNGKPSIEFDGANDYLLAPATSTGSVSQPGTVVLVTDANRPNSSTELWVDGQSSRWFMYVSAGNALRFGGPTDVPTTLTGTTELNNRRIFVAVYNGTSSTMRSNGVAIGTTYSAGTGAMDGVVIGADSTLSSSFTLTGHVCLVMVYGSDITGEPWFSAFESGLIDHYGI
jgi:hypothetical protein